MGPGGSECTLLSRRGNSHQLHLQIHTHHLFVQTAQGSQTVKVVLAPKALTAGNQTPRMRSRFRSPSQVHSRGSGCLEAQIMKKWEASCKRKGEVHKSPSTVCTRAAWGMESASQPCQGIGAYLIQQRCFQHLPCAQSRARNLGRW